MNKSINTDETDAPLLSTGIADLMGKKSVRATFRLHPTVVELMSILSAQLGIKQKSLFDFLMEDEDALHAVAQSRPLDTEVKEQRIQKTFVVSQRSLTTLDNVTKHSSASKDDLIERSIHRLLPILEKERTRQQRRASVLTRIIEHFNQGKALVDDVQAKVGEDDTLYQSLVSIMDAYEKTVADMQELVNKGKRVSEFPLDTMRQDQPKTLSENASN